MKRNISIITDLEERKIVVIHDIRFKGRRKIKWTEVEKYLKQYIGEFYAIAGEKEVIYIGKDLPDEYSRSNDTARLKGTLAKAKANAAQGIPELIEIAENKRYKENLEDKHNINAKYGWYRYDSRFALPIYNHEEKVERYNIFYVEMLVRRDANGKLYLYDIVNIKKKRAPRLSNSCTVTNPFLLIL